MGSIKTGTFYEAVQHGRGGTWTSDDVDAARERANHTLRPWGVGGPTPAQRWQQRSPITQAQRDQFYDAVGQARQDLLLEKGLEDQFCLSFIAQAAVARGAVRRALESLGYLLVRRRQITPPFNSPLRHKIR